jgi:anti-sigma regulatory factor (Ser/Thr protein kinase)
MPSRMTLELDREEDAPKRARTALGGFRQELSPERYQAARLLLTELVTNAVKYGGDGRLEVKLSSDGKVFRAEVIDEGSGFVAPERNPSDLDTPGGWGLHLVDSIADRWGTHQGSTHVWFELESNRRFEPTQRG